MVLSKAVGWPLNDSAAATLGEDTAMTPFPDKAMYIDIHTHRPVTDAEVIAIESIDVPDYIRCCGFDLTKRFSLGIHPWTAKEQLLSENLRFIEENAVYDCIKAIGECGLDKLTATDWELQMRAFRSQAVIGEKVQKPLIIHCVKAQDELLAIKKEIEPKQAWIFHGFRGKPQQMEQLIDHGLYLSFGPLYNEETLRQTPLDRFFLDTDNKDATIRQVYKLVAETLQMNEEELIRRMEENYNKVSSMSHPNCSG
jgi:Mg-dependent DNase